MNQLQTTPIVNFVNTVVIGKFNPAILTPEFISKECHLDFGKPSREQRPPENIFSEIVYPSIIWFMDLQRLQVQEIGLARLEDMSSPKYVRGYLDLLPHTPINMAGINAALIFRDQDTQIFLEKLSDLNIVMDVVSLHGATSCEVTYGNYVSVDKRPELRSVLITFTAHDEAKIRMNFAAPFQRRDVIVDYNWEIGDIGTKPERLDYLVNNRSDIIGILPRLLEAFIGGDK